MPASPKTTTDPSTDISTGSTFVELKDTEDAETEPTKTDAVSLSKVLNKKIRQARLDYSAATNAAKVARDSAIAAAYAEFTQATSVTAATAPAAE
jgi:hypothetical protein